MRRWFKTGSELVHNLVLNWFRTTGSKPYYYVVGVVGYFEPVDVRTFRDSVLNHFEGQGKKGVKVDVTTNVREVASLVQDYAKQIPFVNSLAVNETAKEVQKEEIENLQDRMTVRTGWWTPGRAMGINAKFGNKQTQTAVVGSRADWLGLQEEGGTKKPKTGKAIAVPTLEHRGGKQGVMVKAKKPKAQKQAFFAKMKSGIVGLWKRVSEARTPIKLLFAMPKDADVKGHLRFVPTGKAVIARVWETKWTEAFRKAIATRK